MREQAYRLAFAVDIFGETICKSKYSAKVYYPSLPFNSCRHNLLTTVDLSLVAINAFLFNCLPNFFPKLYLLI